MFRIRNPKEELRCRIEDLREIERFLKDNWLDRHRKSLVSLKREIRSTWNSGVDHLTIPLTKDWRVTYPREDGESRIEYTVFKDDGESDEEIKEILDGYRREIHSMYDCTGQWFTTHMHWSRQPCGIVVVHYLSLDV